MGNYLFQYTNGGASNGHYRLRLEYRTTLPQPLAIGEQFGFRLMTNAGTTIAPDT